MCRGRGRKIVAFMIVVVTTILTVSVNPALAKNSGDESLWLAIQNQEPQVHQEGPCTSRAQSLIMQLTPLCTEGCYRVHECAADTGEGTDVCKNCLAELVNSGFLVNNCIELHEEGFCRPQ